ncbi:MAG TPA: multiheme c-type cytochrome [Steroidobacteraceae bacterium]|nr:multiheme c-type cytochrome [Steroidobacteraceae bacterium]
MARKRGKSPKNGGNRSQPVAPSNAPAPVPDAAGPKTLSLRMTLAMAAAAAVAVFAVGLFQFHAGESGKTSPPPIPGAEATFVGSETCAGCHQAEAKLWRGSQHQLAMAHATDKSVLGNFSDVTFDYFGVKSRFFRQGEKYLVETDGPDGKLGIFEIKYTFGVDPLQQYLVEFPDGRLQSLSIAWDTRPKDKGGQRWFHLYPNEEIRHDDVLHWTKLNQNWNFMCSECHSTGIRKNYDATNDRFATTFAEISVGCEACHGPGSRHAGWARDKDSWWPLGKIDDPTMGLTERFSERRDATWVPNAETGNVRRSSAPRTLRAEVETCGLCHARRGQFSEAWAPGQPLSDTHMVSPIGRGLYDADGQMLDVEEAYNYGSFKQSKMFAAGVTCSDCHDPHNSKLRVAADSTCLQCHSPDKYADVKHHRHEAVTPALACASCHMPTRIYMVVDTRHDHSFRIPRPDISVKLGTPNACNDCHVDKPPEWCAAAIERWYGPDRKGFQNYAEAFHSAWSNQSDAAKLLAVAAADRNTPAIARAGALSELGSRLTPATLDLARTSLKDSDPMVRIGALNMIENLPLEQRWSMASPVLSDPIRGVRIRTASILSDVPAARLSEADRGRFNRAAEQFIAAQQFNADRPEARTTLGAFYARRGRNSEAETEYKASLRLSPQFTGAAINLADLYRQTAREADGEKVLRNAIDAAPNDAGLHHALGLSLVRLKRPDDALVELGRATELDRHSARYAYVYGVALHSAGRQQEAIAQLKKSLAEHPENREIIMAIVSFSREAGDAATALQYAEQAAKIVPDDPGIRGTLEELRRQVSPR